MKKWIVGLALLLSVSTAYAETEVSGNVGYHIWSQTGHTFRYSDVHDKEFNGWCAQLEGTQWWDRWGVYGYIGMDEGVKQEIFSDWGYEADIWYAGVGGKWRTDPERKLVGYVGGGLNFTHMDNRYQVNPQYPIGRRSESWDHFGPDVVTGLNYYLSPRYFVTLNGRYTWNRMGSEVYGKTSFDSGGLRTYLGFGVSF